jgi:hypothetical protein
VHTPVYPVRWCARQRSTRQCVCARPLRTRQCVGVHASVTPPLKNRPRLTLTNLLPNPRRQRARCPAAAAAAWPSRPVAHTHTRARAQSKHKLYNAQRLAQGANQTPGTHHVPARTRRHTANVNERAQSRREPKGPALYARHTLAAHGSRIVSSRTLLECFRYSNGSFSMAPRRPHC